MMTLKRKRDKLIELMDHAMEAVKEAWDLLWEIQMEYEEELRKEA